jgi:hypothetical protein
VRNAEAAGEVTLKKGRMRQRFRLRPIPDADKPEILKAYLDNFKREVQRYFPVPAGSPVQAFRELSPSYPAIELIAVRGRLPRRPIERCRPMQLAIRRSVSRLTDLVERL